MSGMHLKFDLTADQFLTALTEAACGAALGKKSQKPKAPLKRALRKALQEVLKRTMSVSSQCGSHIIGVCAHAQRCEPWSEEAKRLKAAHPMGTEEASSRPRS